ncbi:MAG: Y-family DNA polymerase [Bacteroidales bacterium]|jgi:DNA polymerase V|nr:Y-family DNA polymerase [Bacteroidales bacterium]MCI2133623.1 Y-family DNA polymerase [Bacteroidales bacterium]
MYALVDCNNFFVSCERAFQPELEGRPVVVLSNNDGCVVARSNESKAMGIKMGTPFFKVKYLVDEGELAVRSSNYALYGDLSARVMSILAETAPKLEIYSIDEAFMNMDGVSVEKLPVICRCLIKKIRQWTGIPVSVGVASTKTLGKVANHFAKRYKGYKGFCMIDTPEKMRKALKITPIGDVWGIGRRLAPKLEAVGVKTALDFIERPVEWVQARMGIAGERTWHELQGIRMVEDEKSEARKTICASRSFANMITDFEEISQRVSDFAGKCAEKLRQEGTAAYSVGVFLLTNRFREDLAQYNPQACIRLAVPASSTLEIVGAAKKALRMIFKAGYEYKKAGVIVMDIVNSNEIQQSIFDFDIKERERDDKISRVMDMVNKSGKNVLRLAAQRPGHFADGIRRDYCSKLYSTDWNQLLEVK